MRLATIRTDSGTAAVHINPDDGVAVETGHRDVGELLADDDWQAAASSSGAEHALADVDYAPVVTRPDKVICVGLNYLDHIAETGRERPSHPTLFPKFANTLIGAYDPIALPDPDVSTSVDWEAELGLVIGRSVRGATAEQAADAIAGYTVVNDITVRDFQRHTTQFMPGKAWEGTTPVGPHLVTTDEAGRPEFAISCEVDGEVVQASNTRELCFDPVELVQYISTFTTLVPGDVVATGTPGGVGVARTPPVFLRSGQIVTTRIQGIGECRNVCR